MQQMPGGDSYLDGLLGCLVPRFDGAFLSHDSKDALWDKFYTAAPPRRRQSVEQYEYICKCWTSQPERFKLNPLQQMPGLNI